MDDDNEALFADADERASDSSLSDETVADESTSIEADPVLPEATALPDGAVVADDSTAREVHVVHPDYEFDAVIVDNTLVVVSDVYRTITYPGSTRVGKVLAFNRGQVLAIPMFEQYINEG